MRRLILVLAVSCAAILAVGLAYVGFMAVDADSGRVFRNVTGAMEPTLMMGDRFTTRSLRGEKGELLPVNRGDLVIHEWPPDPTKLFVKRVVGLPGDTLAMREGVLQLNRRPVREPYAWHDEPAIDPVAEDFRWQRDFLVGPLAADSARHAPSRNNWGPVAVPPGAFFVLGDNRDNSLDSRYWGFLPAENVVGRARRVYFSRDPTMGRIRWERFGRLLR